MPSVSPTKMTYRQRLWTVGALALVTFVILRLSGGDSLLDVLGLLALFAAIVALILWMDAGRRA